MSSGRFIALVAIATASAAVGAETAKVAPYELKNRSSFAIKAGTRPPFWPIGWSKDQKPVVVAGAPVVAKAFLIQPNHFKVTSILLSNPPLATINGRAFGEGEFLPVEAGGQPVRVVVKAIRDGGVWLDQSGHQIFVQIPRAQVGVTRPTEEKQASDTFKIQIDAPK
jgi:hypothetical protein